MNQTKKLPPGWDTKLEPKSGKSYFVNYFTKTVTLDDPRIKQEQETLTKETPVRNGHHRLVPLMGASAVHSNAADKAAVMAEMVTRIRSTFPTVPETHIKALLLKYHGREAVVVSALQVEKHPIRTPGPFTPPPPARPIPAVPIACRPQPKPHSPKMKLRYLKSVFPVVEETILLDTLVNADNNVTQATEKLLNLGFNKRDMPIPRVCLRKKEDLVSKPEVVKLPDTPRPKSADEKEKIKGRICGKHPNVPEKVVLFALDSASYNEETAEKILTLMIEEQQKNSNDSSGEVIESETIIRESPEARIEAMPLPSGSDSIKKRLKNNKNERFTDQAHGKPTRLRFRSNDAWMRHRRLLSLRSSFFRKPFLTGFRSPILEEEETKTILATFVSPLLSKPQGPNKSILRGPDETLLLDDYVPWIGSEKGLAQGPDRSLVRGSRGALGSNLSLRKGPCPSLAKGSIYAKFITSSDSRGK